MQVIYISGAYRARTIFGVLWNIYKARRAAQELWANGYAVICPHMNTALFDDGFPYIRGDCEILKRCDKIYMLKGWRKSEGANIEYQVALQHKLDIIYEED